MRRNPANPSTMTAGIRAATKIPTEVEAAAAILLEETILSTVVEVEASEMEDPAAAVALEVAIEAVALEAATEVAALETATEEAVEATGLAAATMTTHPEEALAALVVGTEMKAIATEDIEEAGEVEVDQTSTAITTVEVYREFSIVFVVVFHSTFKLKANLLYFLWHNCNEFKFLGGGFNRSSSFGGDNDGGGRQSGGFGGGNRFSQDGGA
jgi:hypothetical protein